MEDFGAKELCESRGDRPGLPVLNSPYGLRGRNATQNERVEDFGARELCEVEVAVLGSSIRP